MIGARALVIEHQPLGMWTATTVDGSSGEPIQQFTLDDGPGREATGSELELMAESLNEADDTFAGLGKERVVIAGDEQRDSQTNLQRRALQKTNSIESIFPQRNLRHLR